MIKIKRILKNFQRKYTKEINEKEEFEKYKTLNWNEKVEYFVQHFHQQFRWNKESGFYPYNGYDK
jgi:hypothetical protein